MAWVIQDEWRIGAPLSALPLYAQSGESRYTNVDTMILKRVDVLPHGLINTPDLVGRDGQTLVDYVAWVGERVDSLGGPDYRPRLHFDVYGMVGLAAGGDIGKTVEILVRLEKAAGRHPLQIEHPIDAGSRDGQIEAMRSIRLELAARGSSVRISPTSGPTTSTT